MEGLRLVEGWEFELQKDDLLQVQVSMGYLNTYSRGFMASNNAEPALLCVISASD